MADPSSYITPPQITGPGVNMAAELYKMISGLPDAYQQGVEQRFQRGQMKRTEELQKPVVDENGKPITDWSKLVDVWLQKSGVAGIPQALELSKFPMTLEAQRQFQRGLDRPDEPTAGAGQGASEPRYPIEPRQPGAPQLGAEPAEDTVNPRFGPGGQRNNLTGPEFVGPAASGAPPPQPEPPQSLLTPNKVRTVPAPPLTAAQLGREPEAQPATATGVKSEAEIAALRRGAANLAKAAASPLITPAQKDAALAMAKQRQEQADKAQELRDKIEAETNPRVIAAKAAEARGKEEATRYGKDYEGYRKLGSESQIGLHKANLAKAMINDPNFYSGPLEPTTRLFKQFQSTFGANPHTAVPQEATEKVINDMLGEQIRALGGSGVGQVRVAEVNIMRKAIANLGITPSTNRMLVEMVSRGYRDNMEIAKMARDYKGGRPDSGLDAKIAEYYQEHPLFKDKELADPRLIAPREFKSFAAAKAAGLPKGEPVKINGELYHVDTR